MHKYDSYCDKDILSWKSTLQVIHLSLLPNNMRSINVSLMTSHLNNICHIYQTITNANLTNTLFQYFNSIDAFIENIDDVIIELSLALDVLERSEIDANIKNFADGRRIFYQTLYKCRIYLKEALTQFKP